MPPLLSETPSLVSPQTAVLHAKKLALGFRILSSRDTSSDFPLPTRNNEDAYDVLLDLDLISPPFYQWSENGRRVLSLSDSDFMSLFDNYLDRALSYQREEPARSELPFRSLTKTLPLEAGLQPSFKANSNFDKVLTGQLTLHEYFNRTRTFALPTPTEPPGHD